jgi:hypothetical protein
MLLTGCQTSKNGPFGLYKALGGGTIALVDPLFGKQEERCFDRPDQLLAVLNKPGDTNKPSKIYPNAKDHPGRGEKCEAIAKQVRDTLAPAYVPLPAGGTVQKVVKDKSGTIVLNKIDPIPATTAAGSPFADSIVYDRQRRNEIIDSMIAISNKKCASYTAFIKNTDSLGNAGLSVAAIITGGIGPVAGGEATAKALAAASAILSGARAAINEAYLSNQTIQVLATAYEKVRQKERVEISNREVCGIDQYTIMRGLEDAWQYHESCSLVVGLAETAASVQRSGNPGIKEMTDMLEQVAKLHKAIGNAATATTTDTDTNSGTVGSTTTTPAGNTSPQGAAPVPAADIQQATITLTNLQAKLATEQLAQTAALAASTKPGLGDADKATAQKTLDTETVTVNGLKGQVRSAQQTLDALNALNAATASNSEKAACPFS